MNHSELQQLVSMANQISRNTYVRGHNESVDFVEQHLQRFWSRGMKAQLCAYAESDGSDLDECAREAALRLKRE